MHDVGDALEDLEKEEDSKVATQGAAAANDETGDWQLKAPSSAASSSSTTSSLHQPSFFHIACGQLPLVRGRLCVQSKRALGHVKEIFQDPRLAQRDIVEISRSLEQFCWQRSVTYEHFETAFLVFIGNLFNCEFRSKTELIRLVATQRDAYVDLSDCMGNLPNFKWTHGKVVLQSAWWMELYDGHVVARLMEVSKPQPSVSLRRCQLWRSISRSRCLAWSKEKHKLFPLRWKRRIIELLAIGQHLRMQILWRDFVVPGVVDLSESLC